VSVNAVCEQASCPLNWRLFLPESWDDAAMATRRAACHLPAAVHHRPKWRLVLDMLDEPAGWELSPPVLLADCGYGEIGEFRGGLDTREIPTWWRSAQRPRRMPSRRADHGALHRQGPASPPALSRQAILAGQPGAPSRAAGLCGADPAAGQQGPATRPLPGAAGPPGGGTPRRQARADGAELPLHWLLVEWPTGKPAPVKYWLSNLPAASGLAPSRDPGLGRARVSDLGAAAPRSGGVDLTLWQLLGELQILLACWAGACPLCQRPTPRWLHPTGRPPAPT
jgi:hypothetical protein